MASLINLCLSLSTAFKL